MKTLTLIALSALSLNAFSAMEIPGYVTDAHLDSAKIEKVATAFRSRECTEYDSQAVDCQDPIAFKKMVRVYVSYTDENLSIEDKDQFVSEYFDLTDFSAGELQLLKKGKTSMLKLAVSEEPRTFEHDTCNDEYGCINGENVVHSSYTTKMKIISILKK